MFASAYAVDETYALDDVFNRHQGRVFATGLQALIRMAIEQKRLDSSIGLNTAGFISGYRGSPVAGLDLALTKKKALLDAHNIQFHPGLNEALAASTVFGTQQVEATGAARVDGVFAMWYGKGPGVDWAGDAIKHGNAYGTSPHGGVLAIAGDDHGAVSSTMAHQSDQTFKAWSMPVLNPATVADYIQTGLYGWALSRFSGAWVGFKAIAETVEGAAAIDLVSARQPFVIPSGFKSEAGDLHLRLTDPPSVEIEARLLAKVEAARAFAHANRPDRLISDPDRARLVILTTGKAHSDLMEALRRLGFEDPGLLREAGIRIMNIVQSWPIDTGHVRHSLRDAETVLVVEEKRPLIEEQVIELLFRDGRSDVRVLGKKDEYQNSLLPASGELRPHLLAPVLRDELERIMSGFDLGPRLDAILPDGISEPEAHRTPFFCSGCPHNSSTVLPEGSIAFGGIGCHIMAAWMDRGTVGTTQMGGEGTNWIGMAPFVEMNHVFQNLGDGTYMHSGSLAIRAAIAAKSNITFKILFNDAVAMTGGQRHDGALDVPAITRQVQSEGVERIVVVADDPGKYPAGCGMANGVELRHRRDLDKVQIKLRQTKGVSVMIFDQTCAAEKRRRRKRGNYPDPQKRVVINDLVCEACGDCSKTSNCMSIQPLETALGIKRQIDQSSCNKDYSCVDGFCPSFVTVEGAELAKPAGLDANLIHSMADDLPHPLLPAIDSVYEVLVTGIGGTGVLTVGAVIGMAAHLENRAVSVLDFTGLAQKGGAVLSHVRLANSQSSLHQSRIEPRQAHALIACDLVTAADNAAMMTLDSSRSRAVGNGDAMITADFIKDPRFALPLERLRKRIAKRLSHSELPLIDAQKLAAKTLGDTIGANILMLGFAWQRGLLPLSLRAIERAIELNGLAIDANKQAFAIGRIAADDPAALYARFDKDASLPRTLSEVIQHRADFLTSYQDQAYAQSYVDFVEKIELAERPWRKSGGQPEIAMAVARNLFKLMAYKDSYEVARLHTDGRFDTQLNGMFEGKITKRFYMSPPGLSLLKRSSTSKKIALGSWIEPILRLLAKGKHVRGKRLDPMGWTKERRQNRHLIAQYREMLEMSAANLSAGNLTQVKLIAELPDLIRGFGHVREANLEIYRTKRRELMTAFA